MKYTLFTLLLLAGIAACKRFYVDQTLINSPDQYIGCGLATDVWDRYAEDDPPQIVNQFWIPCGAMTDSARAADLKKAQAIADNLNRANQ